jgi:hypothetical protein
LIKLLKGFDKAFGMGIVAFREGRGGKIVPRGTGEDKCGECGFV